MNNDDRLFAVTAAAITSMDPKSPTVSAIAQELGVLRTEVEAGHALPAKARECLIQCLYVLNTAPQLTELRTAVRDVLRAEASRLTGSPVVPG